jgi:hypothetical protein
MARTTFQSTWGVRAALVLACVVAAFACAQTALARSGMHYDAAGSTATATTAANTTTTTPTDTSGYSATMEQCVTSTVQSERSATFTAHMVAIASTQRMQIKIQLQQRMRGETEYRTIAAPSLGEWHSSEPGVRIDNYVQQVTNLTAPAAYRALVQFRWLSDRGRVLKHAELHTTHCLQPALSGQVKQTPTPTQTPTQTPPA